MPLTPEPEDGHAVAAPRPSRRRARLVIAAVAALVLVAGTIAVASRNPDTETAADDATVDELGEPGDRNLRTSEGITDDGGGSDGADRSPVTVTPPGPSPTTTPATEGFGLPGLPPSTASQPRRSGAAPGPAPTGSGRGSQGSPVEGSVRPPTGSTPPPPLYLPGAGDAPVLGPLPASDDDEDTDQRPAPVEADEPAPTEPEPEPEPHTPEEPDPDEAGCPNLDLYPIGGFAENAPDTFATLSPRFRALAPLEWAKPTLVCGYALEPWRDLVVQRLVSGGTADGALVTAADGSSIVLRLSEIEWTTYRFRYGGGPIGPNLVGYPIGHRTWSGVTIVQTTAGGLVLPHPEAQGVPLLGGAWDLWVGQGGPDGPMGIPTGIPESAMGPTGADTWVEGMPSTGARQEFTNGWLFLPGVLTDVEAVSQPAERYEWHDASELAPPAEPRDYRGHIMQISGISFYVDRDGIRHWIRTTSDWSCAHWDLKATEYEVRGYELAQYPLGSEFVCTDFKE